MSEIKYIHCFGTSHTAGGGFEFDSKVEDKLNLKKIYSNSGEPLTQFNFSWPGQLQKLLDNKIQIYNHAKSGFGNELIYRKTFDIVSDNTFNSAENLFIFEFSHIGRQEYYLNEIQDYVIVNYDNLENMKNGDDNYHFELGKNYYYDSPKLINILNAFKTTLISFFKQTKNESEILKEIDRNNTFFYSFLKQIKINFLFLVPPFGTYLLDDDSIEKFFTNFKEYEIPIFIGSEKYNNFYDFMYDTAPEFTISKETNYRIKDGHLGLRGNKLVAYNVYNNLIEKKYISSELINNDKMLDLTIKSVI